MLSHEKEDMHSITISAIPHPPARSTRHLEIREGGDKLEEKFSVFKEEEEDGMVSQR